MLLLEIENNSLTYLKTCDIFLDMSKAFDLVNRQILLEFLNSFGFRGYFSSLLKTFLSGRKFRIKSNYNYSQYYEINRSVLQVLFCTVYIFIVFQMYTRM